MTVDRLTSEIADRAKQTLGEARALAKRARRHARDEGKSVALVERLELELAAAQQVLAQTDLRLAGQRTIPDRRISLVDPDARPLRMGSPKRPTEFGYKARVADTKEGSVIADVPARGNPNDDTLLEVPIAKAKAAGMHVRTVYADRGFGTRRGDEALARQRVPEAIIPRRGRASPAERGAAGNVATASGTGSRAESHSSSARVWPEPGCVASPARRHGSAGSPSRTTCGGWRH